ncbi:MAG: hypothetical protein IT334_10750, partial [Thermomicrobiales bacterium]|nr:hypothetical protein [Thermomicrobiales bacterium]
NSNGNVTGLEIVTPSWAPNGTNKIRVDGVIDQQSSAVTVQRPTVTVDRASGTPGVSVGYEAINFPANSVVSITWRRLTGSTIDLGTVTTDATGSATGSLKIPATPGGPGQIVTFTAGTVAETVTLEVKPRIKVTPATAGRGETIDISLRGFARQEAVVIRWRSGTSGPFQTIASGTTSNTGSANISFTVPASAADGPYQVRAESASFNQQTSAFAIAGGQPVVLSAVDAGEPPATGELPPAIWMAGAPAVVRRAKPWRGKWLSA